MTSDFNLGRDARITSLISVLKTGAMPGAVERDAPLVEGAFFNFTDGAGIVAETRADEDALLSLTVSEIHGAEWFALHLKMGGVSLAGAEVIGVVAKSRADAAIATRVCLRSGYEGGFADAFLPKHVVSYAESSTHIDILRLAEEGDRVPVEADWRELIFFFPHDKAFELVLEDLRVFIV